MSDSVRYGYRERRSPDEPWSEWRQTYATTAAVKAALGEKDVASVVFRFASGSAREWTVTATKEWVETGRGVNDGG